MARWCAALFLLAALGLSAVSAHTVVWCLGRDALLNDVVAMGSYHHPTEAGWNSASVTITGTDPGFSTLNLSGWILEDANGQQSNYFGCGFGCTAYCGGYTLAGIHTWQVKVLPPNTFTQGSTYQITQTSTQAVDQPWPGCAIAANVQYPVLPPLGTDSITCPGDISINKSAYSSCSAVATWPASSVTCTHACPLSSCSVTRIAGQASNTNFPVGTTTVTYQLLLDGLSAPETCSFDVIVTDVHPPTFTSCPADQTICGPSPQVVNWATPVAQDCDSPVTLVGDNASGSSFASGTTTVTYTATDPTGLSSTCAFDITVYSGSASITCPAPQAIVQTASCSAVATWTTPACTPPCITQTCTSIQTSGQASNTNFPVGTTTNAYELRIDGTPDGQTCSFDIVVTDVTAPVMTNCPSDMSACGPAGTTFTWTPPSFTDCQTLVTTSSHNPGDAFPLGTTTVTYTATDPGGLSASCSFDVYLYINTATITCPASQAITQTAGCSAVASWSPPTCTTECTYQTCAPNQIGGLASSSNFPVGTNGVDYQLLIDGNPNAATCSFNIVVTDVTPPVLTGCPADQTASAPPGTTFTWTPPVFSDCQTLNVINSHNPGDAFPIGTTTVTYTATDPGGLSTTCSFDITIEECESTITCPSSFTVSTAEASSSGPGQPAMTFTASYSVTATNTCGNTISITQLSGVSGQPAVIPFAELPMTFAFETTPDPVNGQQDSCSFTVSGIFAQVSSIAQANQYRFGDINTPPPNGVAELGLYVDTTFCWELFNTPAVGDMGTLVISDGSSVRHTFVTLDGATNFDLSTPGSCMTFLGPHQLALGDYYIGVTGTSTLLANNWPSFELVPIADQFQANSPTS